MLAHKKVKSDAARQIKEERIKFAADNSFKSFSCITKNNKT